MRVSKIIIPRPGTLVVKMLEVTDEDKKTEGGIILPDTNESLSSIYSKAKVVKVGGDIEGYKMDCKEGDTILISKAVVQKSSRFFFVGTEKYYQVMEESEYYAKLDV